MLNNKTGPATSTVLIREISKRGGHMRLADLETLNPRAGEILKLNGFNVVSLEWRTIAGKSSPTPGNPLYDTAWLNDREIETLSVVGMLGECTGNQIEEAFRLARRPFLARGIAGLIRIGYLEFRKGGWLKLGSKGEVALSIRNSTAARFSKIHASTIQQASNDGIRARSGTLAQAEALMTACMGAFRPAPMSAGHDPASLDAALLTETVFRGVIRRNANRLRWLGITERDFDASIIRLKACGVIEGNPQLGLHPIERMDPLDGRTPDEVAAWKTARRLGRFRLEEANAAWLRRASREESAAYPYLSGMLDRGHIAEEGSDSYSMTETGTAFVDHIEGRIGRLNDRHPLKEALREAQEALSAWKKRTRPNGDGPAFMKRNPMAIADGPCRAYPPMPGDVRNFSVTRHVNRPRTEADSLPARVFDALACGPADVASLAGILGTSEAKACRAICWLAAKGLVKDSSPGAAERSAAWCAYCDEVGDAIGRGEASLPGSDPDEFACAVTFLKDSGDERTCGHPNPPYPSARKGALPPYASLGLEPPSGTTKALVLSLLRRETATASAMAETFEVSQARIREIVDDLMQRGLVELVSSGPRTFAANGCAHGFQPEEQDSCAAAMSP